MNKIIKISLILSFCLLNQSFAMEQQDYEKYQEIFNETYSLKNVAANWIVNNITKYRSIIEDIFNGRVTEEIKKLIQKKLIEKYKLQFIDLFQIFDPVVLFGESRRVNSVSFSSCGKFALTKYNAGVDCIWNLENLKKIPQNSNFDFDKITWSDFATNFQTNFKNFQKIKTLIPLEVNVICSAQLSPNGNIALTGCHDGKLLLWDLRDLKNIKSKIVDTRSTIVTSIAFSFCGNFALTGYQDGTVLLWDLQDLNNIYSLSIGRYEGLVKCVTFSPCGRFALTLYWNNSIHIWKINTDLILEQLIFLAVLFENRAKKIDSTSILQNQTYRSIFERFTSKEQKKIKKYFKIKMLPDCSIS